MADKSRPSANKRKGNPKTASKRGDRATAARPVLKRSRDIYKGGWFAQGATSSNSPEIFGNCWFLPSDTVRSSNRRRADPDPIARQQSGSANSPEANRA